MVKTYAGIDLSATSKRHSAVSIIRYDEQSGKVIFLETYLLRDDIEIISLIHEARPCCVSIDAPLSLPPQGTYYRKVDLKMKRAGYHVLPPRWRTMYNLSIRGIRLAEELRKSGILVIETHPKSCLKSSGCSSIDELFSTIGLKPQRALTRDEVDAVLASLTCLFNQLGESLIVTEEDGSIVLLPRLCRRN